MKLKIATYNIRHGLDAGFDMNRLTAVISDADIVGIQEADRFCERSRRVDQPAELAKAGGFGYYYFIKAINLGDGEYGCAILSKIPLGELKITYLDSGNHEQRAVGIVETQTGFTFACTHLALGTGEARRKQFEKLSKLLPTRFILCGDFNTDDFSEFNILGGNLTNSTEHRYETFPGDSTAIDNIVTDGKILSSEMRPAPSDHRALVAEIEL